MAEKEYRITLVNDTGGGEESKSTATNVFNDGAKDENKNKSIFSKMAAVKYAANVADRVITSNINMVSLRTGHEALQQRLHTHYGYAKKGISFVTSVVQGAMVAGAPGALINGALNIGNELVNLAIRQNEISVARQQESITQYLNQIRIGANSGRIGKN
ncbi:MAG: hypothetical protein II984_03595 [Clostridia bacterium]|nr:hypothetical protein [Clostridia bacterium]